MVCFRLYDVSVPTVSKEVQSDNMVSAETFEHRTNLCATAYFLFQRDLTWSEWEWE